jgi:DNA-directed RNA polymerase subunit RPC12/RpoP
MPAMAISGALPSSLFHSGRAQCPDCGAALDLVDHQPIVRCGYCGGSSVVERRLRTLEPNISGAFLTADAPPDEARSQKPSHIINTVAQDESHCPTCGVELEPAQTQAISRCPYCKTQSKIERRLRRSPESDEELARMEAEAPDYDQRQFKQTQALIEKVEGKADLPGRVRAARELGDAWNHANARAARLLPRVMQVLRTADPVVEIPLAELVGKLLCSNNIVLSNAVLRAAERFTFDVKGSPALLRALSLGSGVGLKLLLDTADYAAANGANEYACTALWSISTMIERNYAGRMRLAEIVLYRLLYLKGPVQGWAIELAQGQLGLGCRFPTPTLLYFMDDCAAERPELIPYVNECFYDGRAPTEGDYIIRLGYFDKLMTGPAKRALLEHLYSPPPEASDTEIGKCLKRLLSLADDPRLGEPAIKCIADMIDDDPAPRQCVEDLVRTIGDNLPEDIRHAYLRKVPKTPHLTHLPVKNRNYDSPAPTDFGNQIEQWKKLWNEGIRKAVDDFCERQRVAREYWEKIKSG